MQPTNSKVKGKLIVIVALFLTLQCLKASPEERMQMLKARILQRLVQDGWQLVQESQSLIIVEHPITGMQEFAVRLLTTGANGSRPVFRWSVTVIPVSEHYTSYQVAGTINSQNTFGQVTSIPGRNKKDAEYMNNVIMWASAGLPKKYKFVNPRK